MKKPTESLTSISCIIPAYNEGQNLGRVITEVIEQLAKLTHRFEIIVVNDGSQDNSLKIVNDLMFEYSQIFLLDLSRNFGKEASLTAGLEHAQGEVIFQMDADGQHPAYLLVTMFQKWEKGIDVVYAVRKTRSEQSALYSTLVRFFYSLINWGSQLEIPRNAGDFRLMDRRVVNAILSLPERNRFMKGIYAWVGFSSIAIEYDPPARIHGESKFGFFKVFNFALIGLVSFSTFPLKLLTGGGLLLSFTAMFYILWVFFEYFYWGISVPGYATLLVSIVFFSGIQLLGLGILSAYIARMYEEVKHRPIYIIKNKFGEGLKNF